MGKANKLHGFERPKQIKLLPVTLGTWGLLTATFKLKRFAARKHFDKEVNYLQTLAPRRILEKIK